MIAYKSRFPGESAGKTVADLQRIVDQCADKLADILVYRNIFRN